VPYAIGVDVGGTFTDAVAADGEGRIFSAKTPSTPPDFQRGVIEVLDALAAEIDAATGEMLSDTTYIAHGTTSSLNALVQAKVPPVGFLTTKGHRDSIYIMNVEGRYLGRSAHEIQNVLHRRKPTPLVPKGRALEVTERIDAAGEVIVPLDEEEARGAIAALLGEAVEAIAVSLLWSFRNPVHEQRLREMIHEQDPDVYVALSSEVSPRIGEFARDATTIMSSQIGGRLRDYLGPLESDLGDRGLGGPLLVMQSSGGTVTAKEAPVSAITTVGSVLSGGVMGALHLAEQLGHKNVIATDVGGTTFLAGLIIDGVPDAATKTIVNQHPVNVPTLRVQAIGSGGGAIAWIDDGGNLRVGPRSAEADPGPACYDQGGAEPTNTDANLVLGILSEAGLIGGRKPLRRDLAASALKEKIGKPLGMSAEEAAAAIYTIQNSQTADMLHKLVLEAGHDPREFVVYAFGGAGPAHCAAYAAELGVAEVVVPLGPVAAAFSAYGLAGSDVVLTAERSDPAQLPIPAERAEDVFGSLEAEVEERLRAQGLTFAAVELQREVDLRYSMQMVEVTTPMSSGPLDDAAMQRLADDFEALYAKLNGPGSGFREAGIQAITYRVRGIASLGFSVDLPSIATANGTGPDGAVLERRQVCLDVREGFVETPVYDYRRLAAGHEIEGPAVIQVPTTAVVVPPGTSGRIDGIGNLVIRNR
jgi:N-methylhydantoinase A